MATRANLETRIADDLDRSDLSTQVTAAVTDAIQAYEAERFVFNEADDVSATFSASVDVVLLASLPAYFTRIDRIRMRYSGANNLLNLRARTYTDLMDGQDVKAVAPPLEYCVYAEALQFDSLPDQNYTAVLDGVKRLSPGATNSYASNSTAGWFNEGAALIRARAKVDLYAHVIRDDAEALKMQAVEMREIKALKAKLNARNSGRIKPTQW